MLSRETAMVVTVLMVEDEKAHSADGSGSILAKGWKGITADG